MLREKENVFVYVGVGVSVCGERNKERRKSYK